MPEEPQVRIKIITTAEPQAVQRLNETLGITATREKELNAMRAQFMSAAEAEVATVNNLTAASLAAAKARKAESDAALEASKRRPLLAAGLDRERAEMEKLIATKERLRLEGLKENLTPSGAAGAATRGTRNTSMAVLELSRAVEDAQYGVRGMLNNLPPLVQMLGGGAGLAGGLSLAAVGATTLLPMLSEWLGLSQKLDEALGGTAAKLKEQSVAANAAYSEALGVAADKSVEFTAQLDAQRDALDRANTALDRRVKLMEAQAKIALMLEDAQLAADIEDIQAGPGSPQEKARAIANAKLASQDRVSAKENDARLAAESAANQKVTNTSLALASTQGSLSSLDNRQLDATKFSSNAADVASQQEKLKERESNYISSQKSLAHQSLLPGLKAEIESLKADVAAKQRENEAILAANGGTAPLALPAKDYETQRGTLVSLQSSQIDAMRGSVGARDELRDQHAAARDTDAAKRLINTQKIARDYSQATAGKGQTVLNNGASPLLNGQLPDIIGASPIGPFFAPNPYAPAQLPARGPAQPTQMAGAANSPLGMDGRNPLSDLSGPIQKATDALSNSPLNDGIGQLGSAVTSFAEKSLEQQKSAAEQTKNIAKRLSTLESQMKNAQ